MAKIAVTGGSGKAGRAVVRDLLEHGHEVLNIDRSPSPQSSSPESSIPFLRADVTDFGQTLEALSGGETLPGIEAVVHLAAIPSPAHATPDQVFRTNVTSTHTVFAAAARLRLRRVVWASSETTLGLPFERPPDYAPVDEAHVFPESSYALSKVLGEEMARQSRHPERPARARRGHRRRRQLHHRRRGHRDEAAQPRTDGRGLPGGTGGRPRRRDRHAARHQEGQKRARLFA